MVPLFAIAFMFPVQKADNLMSRVLNQCRNNVSKQNLKFRFHLPNTGKDETLGSKLVDQLFEELHITNIFQ